MLRRWSKFHQNQGHPQILKIPVQTKNLDLLFATIIKKSKLRERFMVEGILSLMGGYNTVHNGA
jgi:hypothetical protein